MSCRPVPITEALAKRAGLIIEAIAARTVTIQSDDGSGLKVIDAGHWKGFKAVHPLDGVLESADSIRYTMPGDGHDSAALRLVGLKMTDVQEVERTDVTKTESNVVERHRDVIKFPEGIRYTEQLKHTFSKTVTEQEAAKQAWEVAAKASIGLSYGGITGNIEASAKYANELSRQVGHSETVSDEITKTLEITGPVDLTWEAYRSLDRERRIITARCEFDFAVYLDPGPDRPGSFGWDSFWTGFLPVARREAPETDFMYQGFRNYPLSDRELDALAEPSGALVRFPVDFDNVQTQHIEAV